MKNVKDDLNYLINESLSNECELHNSVVDNVSNSVWDLSVVELYGRVSVLKPALHNYLRKTYRKI